MPGEMTDDPTDAVHLPKVTCAIFFGRAFKSAQPFTARKAELVNEWVGQDYLLCKNSNRII